MLRRVIHTTNSIKSLNYQLRKVTQEPGPLPLPTRPPSSCCGWRSTSIENRRTRQRDKEKGLPANKRKAPGRLIEGATTTNWKQALQQLALVYPERINPHL